MKADYKISFGSKALPHPLDIPLYTSWMKVWLICAIADPRLVLSDPLTTSSPDTGREPSRLSSQFWALDLNCSLWQLFFSARLSMWAK